MVDIQKHEGKKYLRKIFSAVFDDAKDMGEEFVEIDVYAVLVAYDVKCPAVAHAIKKLLCAGQRGKGDELADLVGAQAAISRAIELRKSKPADAG